MTDVILKGPPQSSYVRTARIVCLEKNVNHTLQPLVLGSESHEKVHPWCRVPALQHGDFELFETSAIARYIDELGDGPSLVPAEARDRARMEQWISAINCYVYDGTIRNYALMYVLPMLRDQPPDRAAIEAGLPRMQHDVAELDRAYSQGTWIAGSTLSLADLFVAPIVQTFSSFPEGKAALDRSKHLARAFAALADRPSFHQVHQGLLG